MIKKIEIENYKSLENLSMELGRFNVLIGENGCGKTNILESLVFAAAGVNGKVENEFIALRGGRASSPQYFKSGFENSGMPLEIIVKITNHDQDKTVFNFQNDSKTFSKWTYTTLSADIDKKDFLKELEEMFEKYSEVNLETGAKTIDFETLKSEKKINHFQHLVVRSIERLESLSLDNYLIYAPENFFLRNKNVDAPFVEPVGYRGEGLLKLIKIIKKEKPKEYTEIISHLDLIDWFDNFDINEDFNADSEFTLSDKYLEDGLKSFDIRNANEGFLFVLFYLTIFISDYTPKFFAIDNIDTALNPKLCSKLILVLAELAKKHDKQVIITTHNPSVLDGLNLNDDEERLFVIARNKSGRTRATRIEKKPAVNGSAPVKLSEQFLRGYIGGLPKNF